MNLGVVIKEHNYKEYNKEKDTLTDINQGLKFVQDKNMLLNMLNKEKNEDIIEGFTGGYEKDVGGSLWYGIEGRELIVEQEKDMLNTLNKYTNTYSATLELYKNKYSSYLKNLENNKNYRNELLQNEIVQLNNKLIKYAGLIDNQIKTIKQKLKKTRDQSEVEERNKLELLKEYDGTYKKISKILSGNNSTLMAMVEDSKIKTGMYSYRYYMWLVLALGLGIFSIKKLRNN
jgi:hypothetical protein